MQVIAREIQGFVDNLQHLLIKELYFVDFFYKMSNTKGLAHFGIIFKFVTV
ncbi:hypothetical protein JCM19301_3339 [Jejuia pallidilutea]|uniref:Uncharacterized protein n=1 Tax=Jejuia pallidilutea TaxID=504487 RepID=A0A090VQQ1_9FLAO|nr:hypothetical protein JCM19301_3339 [Jejuia pallidilutea]GAL72711.1 hypothetical protein JCM19302_2371 [Jejuia pallidilutea]